MPHVHLFAHYLAPRDTTRRRSVIQTRDLGAALEIVGALQQRGFQVGAQKLNYPPPVGAEPVLLEVDCSDIGSQDVVMSVTRPPLSDDLQGDKRRVPKGFTTLELLTDDVWRRYFEILARSHAKLASWLHPWLPQGYEGRRDIFFMQSGNSDYKELDACDGTRRSRRRIRGRTAAFLLVQPELWQHGPTYLGLFGMDGVSTLAWACLLRQRHSELLGRPGFHMVELHTRPVPERVPDHRWALDWRAELLFSAPAQPAARRADFGPRDFSAHTPRVPPTA